MLKASELRVGNWVIDSSPASPLYIKVFPEVIMNLANFSNSCPISAIPLTPEILEKCGFKNCESIEVFFELSGFKIEDGKILATHFKRDRGVQILHLHQLQNLYFSLTGTELEINLTE